MHNNDPFTFVPNEFLNLTLRQVLEFDGEALPAASDPARGVEGQILMAAIRRFLVTLDEAKSERVDAAERALAKAREAHASFLATIEPFLNRKDSPPAT